MGADVDAFNDSFARPGSGCSPVAWARSRPPRASTARGESPVITDGPFSESKEYLGGFWIIEAADLDEALDWAARGSKACRAKVEVRPFDAA